MKQKEEDRYIEECRRIEDKSQKYLTTFFLLWAGIIFFFIKRDYFDFNIQNLNILTNDYHFFSLFVLLIILVYIPIHLLIVIIQFLEISSRSYLSEENLDLKKYYSELIKTFREVTVKATVISLLLPILLVIIHYFGKINLWFISFEMVLLIIFLILIYVFTPFYYLLSNKLNKRKYSFWYKFFDIISIFSGSVTIYIFLTGEMPIFFEYWLLFFLLAFVSSIIYSIKYTTKIFSTEFYKFIYNDNKENRKEIIGLFSVYFFIWILFLIQGLN